MSLLKNLGWVAAGIGAIIVAPVTGGASLALIVGAAGTTTAAGAILGGAGGVAAKHIYEAVTGDSENKIDYYKNEAEQNKAGWAESEQRRKQEAQAHQAFSEKMNGKLYEFTIKNAEMLTELKQSKLSNDEAELMFILASAASHADGNVSPEEYTAATNAISLLCAKPEESLQIGKHYFENPVNFDEAKQKIINCEDKICLKRLGVVLDMVVEADDYISYNEQQLLNVFRQHAHDKGAMA